MSSPSLETEQILTVNGLIPPEELGIALTHEHVFFDSTDAWFSPPNEPEGDSYAYEDVSLEDLWWIRQNPFNHRSNMRVQSTSEAIQELQWYADAGGEAIIDVTPRNVGGDPERVREVATETGLNIVHGTGYYTSSTHPDGLESRAIDEIASELVDDVTDGIGETDVRAGIIGEIGLSGRIPDVEERVLRAGARAAKCTGVPLSVHPPGKTRYSRKDNTYSSAKWGLEILDIVVEEGLPANRLIMSHMDRSLTIDVESQKKLLERGAYVEYDLFGRHEFFNTFQDGYPGDVKRLDAVEQLIAEGARSRILFSHDIAQKATRRKYGGHGYAHLLETITPMALSPHWEITKDDLNTIFVDNPRSVLQIHSSS